MANKDKEVKIITVKDLVEEFSLPSAVIRRVLRAAGFRAPQVSENANKFGPRAKYQWEEGSEELKEVRKILGEYVGSSGEIEDEEEE